MPDLTTMMIFLGATLAINLSPGPSMLYVTTRTVAEGRGAGLLSALGMGVGGFIHTLAAALGLSALLMQSSVAFNVVKYIGALYLIYLGITTLRAQTKMAPDEGGSRAPATSRQVFLQGILVDTLNPKIALFFLAFLPQFLTADSGNIFGQILLLGTVFCISGTIVNSTLAIMVSLTSSRVRISDMKRKILRWLSGSILIGLGARLALTDNR